MINNRCGSCASPVLSNLQEISKLTLWIYTAKICFQSDTYFNTDSVTVRCYLEESRLKQGKVTSILQHNILGQIPHAQLLLRFKYGQHLFPDWAQNVSLLLLKWKRAWAFEHFSIGQTCQLNLCPVIRNDFPKPLIFCFHNGACWNIGDSRWTKIFCG